MKNLANVTNLGINYCMSTTKNFVCTTRTSDMDSEILSDNVINVAVEILYNSDMTSVILLDSFDKM